MNQIIINIKIEKLHVEIKKNLNVNIFLYLISIASEINKKCEKKY